jgi:DNA mismatch repair ATPase MutL
VRWRDGELLHQMISLYGDLPDAPPIEERVARSYACRAAVKAGEPLTALEMNELVDRLFATTLPQGDPHRPAYRWVDRSTRSISMRRPGWRRSCHPTSGARPRRLL